MSQYPKLYNGIRCYLVWHTCIYDLISHTTLLHAYSAPTNTGLRLSVIPGVCQAWSYITVLVLNGLFPWNILLPKNYKPYYLLSFRSLLNSHLVREGFPNQLHKRTTSTSCQSKKRERYPLVAASPKRGKDTHQWHNHVCFQNICDFLSPV